MIEVPSIAVSFIIDIYNPSSASSLATRDAIVRHNDLLEQLII